MIKQLFIVFQIFSILLFPNSIVEDSDETIAPFKVIESAEISAPKQDAVFVKHAFAKSFETISVLDVFLTNKIQNVNEIKELNRSRGKTSLPSLNSVWDIANYLVGTGGSCYYVAQLFIDIYMGSEHRIANAYQIDEPVPGDVVYYANGGIGYEHWAIYLGPDTALQGNYLGTTIIGPLYLNNATEPIFYRVP